MDFKRWKKSLSSSDGKPLWSCYAMLCYAKSLQSCPTLCDPKDGSPPGFPVPGILQARTLEWVAISFSNAWKWKEKVKSLSRVRLLATPRAAAYQAPPSMGFSRQEYWSGVPLPSPRTWPSSAQTAWIPQPQCMFVFHLKFSGKPRSYLPITISFHVLKWKPGCLVWDPATETC